jgi:hypothetical protein
VLNFAFRHSSGLSAFSSERSMARRMKPEGGATALAPPADHPSADAEAAVFAT